MDFTPIEKRGLKEHTEIDKIARFFGFFPIETPSIKKEDFDVVKSFDEKYVPSEKATLLRMYFEDKMMATPQPAMLYCDRPFKGGKERKKPLRIESSLITMGSSKSVCECISIQAGLNILRELGYKETEVRVNSIGDKDSMSEFQKQINVFIKKNINSFDAELRQAIKKDPFVLLKEPKEVWKNWIDLCPKSIDFLSEQSRIHFKEVLEFLEIMEIPYSIDHHLHGDMQMGAETVFSIGQDGEELAHGFRFNRLGKKIGYKKDLPSSILNISAKIKKPLKSVKAKTTKPFCYLVQFGPEAKLKSFLILEELYKANIHVVHSIAKDKLGSQMGVAESSDIPYILLIGQKEAIENSVMVRNTANRAQEIVPITELSSYIKSLN